jgi:hypothetical protein
MGEIERAGLSDAAPREKGVEDEIERARPRTGGEAGALRLPPRACEASAVGGSTVGGFMGVAFGDEDEEAAGRPGVDVDVFVLGFSGEETLTVESGELEEENKPGADGRVALGARFEGGAAGWAGSDILILR